MQKVAVILCLSLLAGGCTSNPPSPAIVSADDVIFRSTPPAGGQYVGWASFNDHLTRDYAHDALTHLSQDAAGRGANVVVVLGIDPPDLNSHLGPFDVHGFLATIYVWADLYYCPGLTNAPAQKMPGEKIPRVQFATADAALSIPSQFMAAGVQPPNLSPAVWWK